MTYRNIDVNVSNETKSMLGQVQKFSMEVMRPVGIQLDRLSSPEEGGPAPFDKRDRSRFLQRLDETIQAVRNRKRQAMKVE